MSFTNSSMLGQRLHATVIWLGLFAALSSGFCFAQEPKRKPSPNALYASRTTEVAQRIEAELAALVAQLGAKFPEVQARLDRYHKEEVEQPRIEEPWVRSRYVLYRVTTHFAVLAAASGDYPQPTRELLDRLDRGEARAFNIFFHLQNALYRSVELTGLWAASVGFPRDQAEQVYARMAWFDKRSQSALQQAHNGAARLVELLLPVASQLGVDGERVEAIRAEFTQKQAQLDNSYLLLIDALETAEQVLLAIRATATLR